MKLLWRVLGALAAAVVIVIAIGALLPRQHTASRTAHFRAAPEAVWRAITDVATFPAWRTDVKRVEVLPPLFRFVARFVIGYHGTIDAYLAGLAKRLA